MCVCCIYSYGTCKDENINMATSNSIDQCTILWLDSEVNNSEDNLSAQQKLFHTFNNVEIFEDENTCQQFIRSKPKQLVFLIVSGRLSRQIVPAINSLGHVAAIFIYCMDESRHIEWAKGFSKVNNLNFISLFSFTILLDQRYCD